VYINPVIIHGGVSHPGAPRCRKTINESIGVIALNRKIVIEKRFLPYLVGLCLAIVLEPATLPGSRGGVTHTGEGPVAQAKRPSKKIQ